MDDVMLGCEVLFGQDKAARIQARMEDATGDLCPCKRDLPCPLLGPPLRAPMVPAQRFIAS